MKNRMSASTDTTSASPKITNPNTMMRYSSCYVDAFGLLELLHVVAFQLL